MEQTVIEPRGDYELLREVSNGVWIAVRRNGNGGEQYLARRVHEFDAADEDEDSRAGNTVGHFTSLMYDLYQGFAISRILNHENLVSHIDYIRRTPSTGADNPSPTGELFIVCDYCDASNLRTLLQHHPHDGGPLYLPESLCWHVLRSLTRAVAYLHDGRRTYCLDCIPSYEDPYYDSEDKDWLPILHRAIEPENIHFQHPLGKETYGPCKLGNFSQAFVSGHAISSLEQDNSRSLTVRRGHESLRRARHRCTVDPEKQKLDERPYDLGDEFWSIGNVLFTMMVGEPLSLECNDCGCCHVARCSSREESCIQISARERGCRCLHNGCEHLSDEPCDNERHDWAVCEHHEPCRQPDINIDISLARTKYSRALCSAVRGLLEFYPMQYLAGRQKPPSQAFPTVRQVERLYHDWREAVDEAKGFVAPEVCVGY